jgi:hypothetical protein
MRCGRRFDGAGQPQEQETRHWRLHRNLPPEPCCPHQGANARYRDCIPLGRLENRGDRLSQSDEGSTLVGTAVFSER